MLERCDSFDIYANANGSTNSAIKAESQASLRRRCQFSSLATTTNVNARTNYALSLETGGGWQITAYPRTAWVIGFGFYFGGPLSRAGTTLYQNAGVATDGTTTAAQFRLLVNTDGTFSLYARSTLIATSTVAVAPSTWHFVELDIGYTINGGGTIQTTASLWLDDTLIASGNADTGLNPNYNLFFYGGGFASGVAGTHSFGSPALGSALTLIDDLYILNKVGTLNISRLGPIVIGPLFPASDVSVGWSTSSGVAHFALVNENPEDADATFLSTAIALREDLFTWQKVSSLFGTIPAIQLSTCHRKTDNGNKVLQPAMQGAGALPSIYAPGNYQYDLVQMDQNPVLAAPWTVANFDSGVWGVELIS